MQRFCINFNEYSHFYDFFDSQSIVSDFLTVFENNFVLRNGIVSLFECSFTIINHQPPPKVGFVDILDSCVWQTDVYSEIYFMLLGNLTLQIIFWKGWLSMDWLVVVGDSKDLTEFALPLTVIKKVKLVNNLMRQGWWWRQRYWFQRWGNTIWSRIYWWQKQFSRSGTVKL